MYELRYICNIIPVQKSEALERGTSYHECVEALVSGKDMPAATPKVVAMVNAFKKYVYPFLDFSSVEEWKRYNIGDGRHIIYGRVDGIDRSGAVIEHKTVSGEIDGDYLLRLDIDEQIPTYMLACNTNDVIYTVCSTPTIRQKKDETDDEYISRCAEWYAQSPHSRCTTVRIHRSDEELAEFAKEQCAVVDEIENCKSFFRNPNNCLKWGRLCEYAPICKKYDPNVGYVNFVKREAIDYYGSEKT